jgi:hypothetical protein
MRRWKVLRLTATTIPGARDHERAAAHVTLLLPGAQRP